MLLFGSGAASAHPHVFAEARLDVVLDAGGQHVTALRHLWRFDDLFSSTVLMEFDKNADQKLDDEELKEVSDTIHSSLADYNYFQLVTVDGKDVKMKPPAQLIATFDNEQLIVLFESVPALSPVLPSLPTPTPASEPWEPVSLLLPVPPTPGPVCANADVARPRQSVAAASVLSIGFSSCFAQCARVEQVNAEVVPKIISPMRSFIVK